MDHRDSAQSPHPDARSRGVVIFDLDGTLTRPILDFDAIRAEIGIPSGPILEAMDQMGDAARVLASEVLAKHEWEAARRVTLYGGAVAVVAACRSAGFATAVLTRNTRSIVDFLVAKFGLTFDAIRTREDGAVKPSPEPLLSICSELGSQPGKSWMVGDFLFDIISGRAAGTRTVLMIGDNPAPDFASQADHVISELCELLPLVGVQGGGAS